MDYSVREVDIADKELLCKVNSLLSDTFGNEIPSDKLERCTKTNSIRESLYLAATKGDEIIGFNAFISHDFILNGLQINCYQSCWTATSNAHRGQKIFQNLINGAKEILSEREAAFIFGFPNPNSQPIFTKKLGFKEIPSLKWQTPNLNIIRNLCLRAPKTSISNIERNAILPNDNQLIALKRKWYKDELLVVEFKESFIWGVPRKTKKLGASMKYFEIGGMSISDPPDIKPLFNGLSTKAGKFHYFQFSSSSDNSFNVYFRNLKPAQTNDLIVFDLGLSTEQNIGFNFFGGVKDVF